METVNSCQGGRRLGVAEQAARFHRRIELNSGSHSGVGYNCKLSLPLSIKLAEPRYGSTPGKVVV